MRCLQGAECLGEHRLKPDSPTRRVVATCCNTAMFADFTKGHWISIYRDRLNLDGVPTDKRSVSFVLRLVGAWVAMAFRAPRIDYVKGRIDGIEN
ncbi:MAG: hypothetical protein LJE67_01125 [Salaquimonas sp.]|nr:hypothetical protein [Salaquimonas sp.]